MGSATIHMPSFPYRKSLRASMTSPSRKSPLYDVRTPTMTSRERENPQPLTRTAREEEVREIVARLSRPTTSSRMKSRRAFPQVHYVDMDCYQWHRLPVYADYQRQIYSSTGAVKTTFRKCGIPQQAAFRISYV